MSARDKTRQSLATESHYLLTRRSVEATIVDALEHHRGGRQPLSPSASLTSVSAISDATTGRTAAFTPVQILEYQLLAAFLSLILSLPLPGGAVAPNQASLALTLRPPPAGSHADQEPMLPLNALKAYLGEIAKQQDGWAEDLGTKAVYGLVAKRVIRIDRSGRESFIGFTM